MNAVTEGLDRACRAGGEQVKLTINAAETQIGMPVKNPQASNEYTPQAKAATKTMLQGIFGSENGGIPDQGKIDAANHFEDNDKMLNIQNVRDRIAGKPVEPFVPTQRKTNAVASSPELQARSSEFGEHRQNTLDIGKTRENPAEQRQQGPAIPTSENKDEGMDVLAVPQGKPVGGRRKPPSKMMMLGAMNKRRDKRLASQNIATAETRGGRGGRE